ncbi:MAG: type II toxin-antitoxin system RelE/ParE family toxin [Chloroflexota bacterium]
MWIEPEVHSAREGLPGNVRQRVKQLLESLGADPRPPSSKALDVSELDVPLTVEVRRVRFEHWRVLYAVNDREGWVWALGIYRRPPYQYEDLKELVSKLQE